MKQLLFLLLFVNLVYGKNFDDTNTSTFIKEILPTLNLDKNISSYIKAKLESADTLEKSAPTWEEQTPDPLSSGYDWVQLNTGEWLKGEVKVMYKQTFEFSSEKMHLKTFKWKDIKQLKTYYFMNVNVEDLAILRGRLFIYEDTVVVLMGENQVDFKKSQIISIAHGGTSEKDFWSLLLGVGLTASTGNTNRLDYSANVDLQRRTATTRLQFLYNGALSYVVDNGNTLNDAGEVNIDNHRINFNYDIYYTKEIYFRPVITEYFTDIFQNIKNRYTLGVGVGYILVNNPEVDLDFTLGPTVQFIEYDSVVKLSATNVQTPSINFSVQYKQEITDDIDYKAKISMNWTTSKTGRYSHHTEQTLDTEIIENFEFDLTFMWDYTYEPVQRDDGTYPLKNDLKLINSIKYNF